MNVDVHAWTPEMNSLLQPEYFEKVLLEEWQVIVSEIQALFETHFSDEPNNNVIKKGEIVQAFEKIKSRYDVALGGYLDPDLKNVNVVAILKYLWLKLKLLKSTELLLETLMDVGQTCVQGDSHRFLFLLHML